MKQIKKNKSFVQWFVSLFIVLFLGIGSIFFSANVAFAASPSGINIPNLSIDYTSGTGYTYTNVSSNSFRIKVQDSSSSGCTGTTYKSRTCTITFKAISDGILTFSVSKESGSGSCSTTGSVNQVLAENESYTLTINSAGASNDSTQALISNIEFAEPQSVDVTFLPASNGSYTVDGQSIIASTTLTKSSTESFSVAASPASGFKFFGWHDVTNDEYLSANPTDNILVLEDCSIVPEFVSNSTPIWDVDGKLFTDLNAATAYSQQSGKNKITLAQNGTLVSGNYEIPNGKTLLIPYDNSYTIVQGTPKVNYNTYSTPTAFRILTMASGASITVKSGGAISCAGELSSKGQLGGTNGTPMGPDGRINMQSGSTIDVESGGILYVWGYIYGSGSVIARSGSTIYEAFQIKDWRGGTATSNCYSYTFIFNQYYIQNIEVPLTIYAGATEKLYSAANASSKAYTMEAVFIGNSGLFRISSGYLIKDYIESSDRLHVSVYGTASISPMTISGLPLIGSIGTDDYEMPITSNITIDLQTGTTATISQDIKLLPSVELNIQSGASLNIASNKNMFIYDIDDWGLFTGSAQLYVVGYSVANGTTTKRTAAGLADARINVNGTVTVSGKLYTSSNGANIYSSEGTGKVIESAAPGTSNATIYEMASNSTKTAVTFNPARLHDTKESNSTSTSYTETKGADAGSTFYFCDINAQPKWYNDHSRFTITFDANGGSGTISSYQHTSNGHFNYEGLPSCSFTPPTGQVFSCWNTKADGTGVSYNAGSSIHVDGDITLYATWVEDDNTYTITWKNYDGTVLETDLDVHAGAAPTYNGATPTKPGDAQTTYTFMGWDTSADATSGVEMSNLPLVSGDATYFAIFTSAAQTYTITFQNYDGTILDERIIEYGATPTYNGATPSKPSTDEYSYTFSGWTPAIAPVTGDATYTATFTETIRSYTVTWKNEDGSTLETDSNVSYGATPTYNGATPSKPSTDEYSYTFSGWTPAIAPVTGDATYTATFTETIRSYTVTWKNGETVLETDTGVTYGSHPSYDGETPVKVQVEGDRHHYTFKGWALDPNSSVAIDASLLTISGETSFYAIFDSYVIGLFRDDDGYVRLYDVDGSLQDDVSGLFKYDSSYYEYGDDQYYYLLNGVVQEGYGLVALKDQDNKTYLFYVLENGQILMQSEGCTFYVFETNHYKVNGINVDQGLYYFDSDGHMWLGNSLLTDNLEFRLISSELDTIVKGGN